MALPLKAFINWKSNGDEVTLAQAGTTNLLTRNANLAVDLNRRRKNLLFVATNRKNQRKKTFKLARRRHYAETICFSAQTRNTRRLNHKQNSLPCIKLAVHGLQNVQICLHILSADVINCDSPTEILVENFHDHES